MKTIDKEKTILSNANKMKEKGAKSLRTIYLKKLNIRKYQSLYPYTGILTQIIKRNYVKRNNIKEPESKETPFFAFLSSTNRNNNNSNPWLLSDYESMNKRYVVANFKKPDYISYKLNTLTLHKKDPTSLLESDFKNKLPRIKSTLEPNFEASELIISKIQFASSKQILPRESKSAVHYLGMDHFRKHNNKSMQSKAKYRVNKHIKIVYN